MVCPLNPHGLSLPPEFPMMIVMVPSSSGLTLKVPLGIQVPKNSVMRALLRDGVGWSFSLSVGVGRSVVGGTGVGSLWLSGSI